VANNLQQTRNRNRWRNGQDSAAETRLWPRIRGSYLAVEPEISSNCLILEPSPLSL